MGECATDIYHPRNHRDSPLFQLVEDYMFERCYEEKYEKTYGYWRPVIRDVIFKFLECGNLENGFARVRCKGCGNKYLLAFSCKTRCLCPSCCQRRSVEFGERLQEVMGAVPIRSCTFTIPKMLRPYFGFDHKLYPGLCQCVYETVKESFQALLGTREAVPGMVGS